MFFSYLQQEAQLSQRDQGTRYAVGNLVNCRATVRKTAFQGACNDLMVTHDHGNFHYSIGHISVRGLAVCSNIVSVCGSVLELILLLYTLLLDACGLEKSFIQEQFQSK